jgi:DNA primase
MVWQVKDGLASSAFSTGALPQLARMASQELPVFSGSDDAKDRVRQAIDIVDVVGESIQLRRQGRMFVGLCPWHDDSRPSLNVNPDRQTWKCWVCNLGGDIFSFVMQREGIDFRQALEMLAERARIELKPQAARIEAVAGSPEDKNTLYRAMAWASEQYHNCLLEQPEAEVARVYLDQRGIQAESIRRYQLGYAPNDWQWLVRRAAAARFSPEVLQAVGLALLSDRGKGWFDRFRGRVMFPIFDPQRRPIAVGGRILPQWADDKSAKYINSPETRLFSKSEQLYGLHLARDVVSRRREVVVMEGYTDVVIARQFGVDNAVAVLGTALGQRHIQLLRRFADRITLLLDGDQAGQRRASELVDLFISNQVELRIVTLPGNLDPCDFLLQQGSEALRDLIAQAPDAWEYKIQLELRDINPSRDTHRANQALENLLSTLAKAPRMSVGDSGAQWLRQQQFLNRLAREFRLDQQRLRERLDEQRRQRPSSAAPIGAAPAAANKLVLTPVERDLFELLLQQPSAVDTVLDSILTSHLKSITAQQLLRLFAAQRQQGLTPDIQGLLLATDDPQLKSLLVELDEGGSRKTDVDREQALVELLQTLKRRHTEEQLQRQQLELENGVLDEQQKLQMLLEMLRTKQTLIDN